MKNVTYSSIPRKRKKKKIIFEARRFAFLLPPWSPVNAPRQNNKQRTSIFDIPTKEKQKSTA